MKPRVVIFALVMLFLAAPSARGDDLKRPPVVRVGPNRWAAISLIAVQSGALLYDGISTRACKPTITHAPGTGTSTDCAEQDPLARAFLGTKPTWGRMIPFGVLEVAGSSWAATRLRRLRGGRWYWWTPQAAFIAAHVTAGIQNRPHERHKP